MIGRAAAGVDIKSRAISDDGLQPLVSPVAQCLRDALIVGALKFRPAAVFIEELLYQHFNAEDGRHFDADLSAETLEIDLRQRMTIVHNQRLDLAGLMQAARIGRVSGVGNGVIARFNHRIHCRVHLKYSAKRRSI